MTDGKLLRIGEVAEIMGVSEDTVRRWEVNPDILLEPVRLPSQHRRYTLEDVRAAYKKVYKRDLVLDESHKVHRAGDDA